jgi:hypothetical protein
VPTFIARWFFNFITKQDTAIKNTILFHMGRDNYVVRCWDPKVPQKFWKSHWCVPFTATFSKRRKIGALRSERCDVTARQELEIPLQFAVTAVFYVTEKQSCHTYKHAKHYYQPPFINGCTKCYPEGCAAPSFVPCQCWTWGPLSKLERTPPQIKMNVTNKSPVGDISVVTLIRTDTTLDQSQKAEKVWTDS